MTAPLLAPLALPSAARRLRLMWIPPGDGVMGLPADEPTADPEEHAVSSRLTRGFYLGETPVTQAQWWAVMGAPGEPSPHSPDVPVTGVSWDDAVAFGRALEPLLEVPPDMRVTLPTEQQWEHACRAGTRTRYYFGDDESGLADHAWLGDTSPSAGPKPVARKQPNPWGLYDMLGNVGEWCLDFPDDYDDPSVDRVVTGNGVLRCVRGASYRSGHAEGQLLCGRRGWMDRHERRPWQGFRVAVGPPP